MAQQELTHAVSTIVQLVHGHGDAVDDKRDGSCLRGDDKGQTGGMNDVLGT